MKDLFKKQPTEAEPFVYLTQNTYAVPTPGPASKIEDFFDDAIKKTVVDGKTFNDGKNADTGKHYSKTVFAHKVVRPSAETIDYSGFRPLLSNLVAVLHAHKARVMAQASGA